MATILFLDDPEAMEMCVRVLNACGHACHHFQHADDMLDFSWETQPDLVVLNPHINGGEGLFVLETLKARDVGLPVVLYTDTSLFGDSCDYFIADKTLVKQPGHAHLLAFIEAKFGHHDISETVPFHEFYF
ncbi:MAG: response regulator [bacterium]|nr:response regulator [bacterium]